MTRGQIKNLDQMKNKTVDNFLKCMNDMETKQVCISRF